MHTERRAGCENLARGQETACIDQGGALIRLSTCRFSKVVTIRRSTATSDAEQADRSLGRSTGRLPKRNQMLRRAALHDRAGGRRLDDEKHIALRQDAGGQCIVTMCELCHLDAKQPGIEKRYGEKYSIPIVHFMQLLGLALGMDSKTVGLVRNTVPFNLSLRNIRIGPRLRL